MFDAPIIFNALWRAVSPFIDADTKKKVIFISGSTGMAELLKVCSPEVRILHAFVLFAVSA